MFSRGGVFCNLSGGGKMKRATLALAAMLAVAMLPVAAETVGWWRFNGTPGADASTIPSAMDDNHPATLQTKDGFAHTVFSAAASGDAFYKMVDGVPVRQEGTPGGSVYLTVTNQTDSTISTSLWYKIDATDLIGRYNVDVNGVTKDRFNAFTIEMISRHGAGLPGAYRGVNFGLFRNGTKVFSLSGISSSIQFVSDTPTGSYINKTATYDSADDPFPSDDKWHHVALVHDGAGTFHVYRDGVDITKLTVTGKILELDTNKLKYDFIIGPGAHTGINFDSKFSIDEVRVSDTALAPSEFLRSSWAWQCDGVGSTIAYWNFDAPGRSGMDVGTEYGAITSVSDGNKAFDLRGSTFTNGSNFATFYDPAGDYQPIFTNEVPAKYIWDEASGKLYNHDNSTSVFFKHESEAGVTQQGRFGSALNTEGLTALGSSPVSNLTMECFVKVDKVFRGNVSGVMQLQKKLNYGAGYYALLDLMNLNTSTGSAQPRAISHQENQAKAGSNISVDEWHHIAMNYDVSSGTSTVVRLWVDHQFKASNEYVHVVDFKLSSAFVSFGGNKNQYPLSGLVDEPRITVGNIGEGHFLRPFTPRADLTGVWLAPTNATLSGAEWSSPDTAYLAARWDEDAVSAGYTLPLRSMRMKIGGRTVPISNSVVFSGEGGATILCAAIVGTNVFTVEANVCGTGTVFAKKRRGGTSWSVGTDGSGNATLGVNDALTASSAALGDGGWHHVAIVVDRASGNTATLYVDGAVAASADASGMLFDTGDLVVGEDFTGSMAGVRFSPGIVPVRKFMVLSAPKGSMISFK